MVGGSQVCRASLRVFACYDGWCQDIIQAAMLNLTDEAATQLASRAAATDHGGFRFAGFAGHYQVTSHIATHTPLLPHAHAHTHTHVYIHL